MKTFIISMRYIRFEGQYYNDGDYIADIRNNKRTLIIIALNGFERLHCVRIRSIDQRTWQYKLIYKPLISN